MVSPTSATFDAQNEQTNFGSNSLAYDHAGDMTTDQNGNSGYDYDAWGRLRISQNGFNDYFYDALGRRVQSDGTGTERRDHLRESAPIF